MNMIRHEQQQSDPKQSCFRPLTTCMRGVQPNPRDDQYVYTTATYRYSIAFRRMYNTHRPLARFSLLWIINTRITGSEKTPFCRISVPRVFGMIALEYCCTCGPAISLPAGFTISETVVLLMFGMLFYRPKIMGSENRKQTGFPLCGVETHTRLWLLSVQHQREKRCFSHIVFHRRFLASQDTGHHQTWRAYAPLSWEFSLPSLRAVGGMCLEVSDETWEHDPFLGIIFWSEMTSWTVSQKVDTELGQAPTFQARPRDTSHLYTALKLGSDATWSMHHQRRGLVAPVKCRVRKPSFFRCPGRLWNRTREARARVL